ncbi:MAG TPA: TetR/AcrR family transcriptional regulator [Motilibacteraceae bacterium]|nr:TetR/AcrR family transcriptional regulator [Motilibacteraceae bacterium]
MPYRRTTLTQERLDSARDRIATSALALVSQGGWAACTVAAVARRAEVATGTVYSHFPSKAALCAEVFGRAAGREVEAVRAVVDSSAPAGQRVAGVVDVFAGRALKAPRLAHALLAEPVEEAVDAERFRYRRAHRDLLAQVLREGVDSGELPAQDVDVVAAALVGAIAEAVVVPLGRGTAPRPSVDALRDFALRAVGAVPEDPGGGRARHA